MLVNHRILIDISRSKFDINPSTERNIGKYAGIVKANNIFSSSEIIRHTCFYRLFQAFESFDNQEIPILEFF